MLGPGTPSDLSEVAAPGHGPGQRWGNAAGVDHDEHAGRGNTAKPKSLQSKYRPIAAQPDPAVRDDVQVLAPPDPAARGFDAATSREAPELRGVNQRTFDNTDGTQTTEFSRDPINFQRPDGTWQPIDTHLVTTAKDNSPAEGWHNAADSMHVWTAPTAGGGPLTRLDLDAQHQLAFGLDGAARVAGQAKNDTVAYTAVRPSTDIKLQVTSTGVKESIVLQSADAPHSFVFPLQLKGLTASMKDGEVIFSDPSGKQMARIPSGYMADSSYDPHKGEAATSYKVSYRLVKENGGVAVRLDLDDAWLNDPARSYPVVVDPPVDVRAAGSSMYVQRNSDGTNFSRTDDLKVGHSADSGGSYTAASYLAFPGVETALRNHKIFGARLSLTNYLSWSCNARPVSVYPVTQAWTAGNDQHYPGPSYGSALSTANFAHGYIPQGQTTSPCPTATEAISLGAAGRDLVQRWVTGQQPNYGLTVRASETDVFGWKKFTEAGTANPPRLAITHTPYDADYRFVSPVPNPPVTRTQGGAREAGRHQPRRDHVDREWLLAGLSVLHCLRYLPRMGQSRISSA